MQEYNEVVNTCVSNRHGHSGFQTGMGRFFSDLRSLSPTNSDLTRYLEISGSILGWFISDPCRFEL